MTDRRYPSRRFFVVTFDHKQHPTASTLTRAFHESAASNPVQFFHDGYDPAVDIKKFLRETPPEKRHSVIIGFVKHTPVAEDKLMDEIYVSQAFQGTAPPIPTEDLKQKLGEKVKQEIYHALDVAAERMRERMESGYTERPEKMGMYDYDLVMDPPEEARVEVRPLTNPANPDARPEGWNARKEHEFPWWLREGKPGIIASGGGESEQFLRFVFNDMLKQIKQEDAITDLIRQSKGKEN